MDIQQIITKLNGDFRQAQNLMFNGKKEESAKAVSEILSLAGEGLQKEPSNAQLISIRDKAQKLKTDLERRGIALESKTPAKPVEEKTEAVSKTGSPPPAADIQPLNKEEDKKMPQGVERRLQFVIKAVQNKDIAVADQNMKEVMTMYHGQFDDNHPLYLDALKQYNELKAFAEKEKEKQKEAAAEQEKKKLEQQKSEEISMEWLHKFNRLPYFGSFSDEPGMIRLQREDYQKARDFFEDYLQQAFNRAEFLLQKEHELEERLKEFPSLLSSMLEKTAANVSETITSCLNQLKNNDAWKQDAAKNTLPLFVSDKEIAEFEEKVNEVGSLFLEEAGPLLKLRSTLEELKQYNAEMRKARAERIFMSEQKYKGNDIQDIVDGCAAVLKKYYPEAVILKSSVVSEEWKEESGWKFTDSTNTESVFETVRSISVQAALAHGKEKTILHSVHVEQKKKSDGTWSAMYGNEMYSETMLHFNVK
jgi:predicted RNase H-like HicB family nuclease